LPVHRKKISESDKIMYFMSNAWAGYAVEVNDIIDSKSYN